MEFSPDRLVFSLALLEGEKDVHKMLADLLEEQGERGKAQWARCSRGKSRSAKRLDLALAVIPCSLAIQIGADYVDHVLAQRDKVYKRSASLKAALEQVRTGAANLFEGAPIAHACRELETVDYEQLVGGHHEYARFSEPWHLGRSCSLLASAVRSACLIEPDAAAGAARARDDAERTAAAVRKSARHTRAEMATSQRPHAWHRSVLVYMRDSSEAERSELHWQVEHAKTVLEQALHA